MIGYCFCSTLAWSFTPLVIVTSAFFSPSETDVVGAGSCSLALQQRVSPVSFLQLISFRPPHRQLHTYALATPRGLTCVHTRAVILAVAAPCISITAAHRLDCL